MAHKHTCLNCGKVIEEGDFDCEIDADHDFALCDDCADTQEETMDMCEYCSNNGIETPATMRVTYRKSDYADVAPEEDSTITMAVCDDCAENGCPANSKKVAL